MWNSGGTTDIPDYPVPARRPFAYPSMSTNLTPALSGGPPPLALPPTPAPAVYRPEAGGEESPVSIRAEVGRAVAALQRFKWLVGLVALLGAGGGFMASRLVEPTYAVQSAILLTSRDGGGRGPISEGQVFGAQGWIDLLRTNAIADSVVMKLALYVEPEKARDARALQDFQLNLRANRFVPGEYELKVTGPRWALRDKFGIVSEQGVVGDSVGRTAGFAWVPSRAALGADRTIAFRVRQPREASVSALSRLRVGLAEGSNLIFLRFTGSAAQKPAETLNAWDDQFIRIAADIKTAKVAQSSRALAEQRADAERNLADKERAFEQYRVQTAGLPSDALAIQQGPGGVAAVRNDPVLDNYTQSKYQLEFVRRQREQLQRVAATLAPDRVPVEALLNVTVVNSDPVATTLKQSLAELLGLDTDIRVLRRTLQDRTPPLSAKLDQRHTLTSQEIPRELADVIEQLRQREVQLSGVVTQSTGELRAIPQRTTQLGALQRDRDAAAALFTNLNARFAEMQLAEKSLTPDVRVLDSAVMPSQPTENTLTKLLTFGLVAGLGLGLGLALLLDRLDGRFRYPMQVTGGLKLQILGVVPEVDQERQSPERVAQVVEAFRSLRMNVRYACMPNPRVTLTVTSPGPNDGKSLVASNLALAFAEGGWRTVLVDGDVRRGQLNATFDLPSGPGLAEYLEGASLLGEVVQQTSHPSLALVATGTRHRRGPELLATPRMQQLVAALSAEFDAVIVDSPPLGAGTDAYALGAATANVALVLRRSATDLRMTEAKLQALDTLPVQVIGAVLNEVEVGSGLYQHYAYDPDYVLVEENEDGVAASDEVRLLAGR